RRAQEQPSGNRAPVSLSLEAYAGTYADSLNGTMRVTAESGALHLAWENHPGFTARLEPWQYNSFKIVNWESAGVLAPLASMATFQSCASGRTSARKVSYY